MTTSAQAPQTAQALDNLTLNVSLETRVRASLETTFASLLEQIGPANERHDGTKMPMKIEAWPGGRWFRDLGDGDGHFWGHVQAIKRPTLLEISGPLFASYPLLSNVQYRLFKTITGGESLRAGLIFSIARAPERRHRAGRRSSNKILNDKEN